MGSSPGLLFSPDELVPTLSSCSATAKATVTGTTGHGMLGIAREMNPAGADTQRGLAQNPLRMSKYANAEIPYR